MNRIFISKTVVLGLVVGVGLGLQPSVSLAEDVASAATPAATNIATTGEKENLAQTVGLPENFIMDASLRARYEFVGWADPGVDGVDADYAFPTLKAQLGIGYRWQGITAYAQGQYSQAIDLPDDGVGVGASYYNLNSGSENPGDVYLRQAYLSFDDNFLPNDLGLTAIAGRFLYSSGMEVAKTGNKTVDIVKKNRVGERLIGPSDYAFGRSFDGMRINYFCDECAGNLSLGLMRPTQGVYHTDGFVPMRDIDLVTASYTTDNDGWPGEGEMQLFYTYYDDNRDELDNNVKVDNNVGPSDFDSVEISNYGMHWVQAYPNDSVTFDSLLWGVLQAGSNWGLQDHTAGAWAVEGGAKFEDVYGQPWLRAGWNYGSGDDDPTDNDHNTFYQMLPTARKYAATPFYNMQNTSDLFAQTIWTPIEIVRLEADYHYLTLAEENDLFYSGTGPSKRKNNFGFSGLPSGGDDQIGSLIDFHAWVDVTENVGLYLYYGHLFGGDVLDNNYKDSDIDYGYAEVTLKM